MSELSVERLKALMALLDQARFEYVQGQTLGVRQLQVDLSQVSTTAPKTENVRGYGVVMPMFNQAPGTYLTVAIDGVPIPMMPGARVMSPFQRIEVFNTSSGANAGLANLFIITRPDVWLDLGQLGDGSLQTAPNVSQAYNSAANVPTTVLQGVPLTGGRGVRATVKANGADTITSGLGVWWLWDDVALAWAESPVQIDLSRPTARNFVATGDEFTTVSRGRAFLEVRSLVTSGGAGNCTVNMFAN